MAGRGIDVPDVREVVRRIRLGESDREIRRDLGLNRRTVAKYHEIAEEEGWLSRPDLPPAGEIELKLAQRAPVPEWGLKSSVEPHRETVVALRAQGVEAQALWQLLRDQHGYTGHYSSVLRFVRRLEPRAPEAFVRIETKPGEEAQVDFGYAGKFLDPRQGRLRKGWVFVMTLSWSRHQYAEIVFDQTVATWIALHVRAFAAFGGVPAKIVIDNLKAAIAKAVVHDPLVQQAYREFAEHTGFLIAACRPRTPEHKGKVESGVHYVKRNALAGREFPDLDAANAHLVRWIEEVAGVRDHGTTHERPLVRFEVERGTLGPLPAIPYEVAVYKEAKLHPDCHVVFDRAYYSAPHRLIGERLLLRATRERVELFHRHQLVATHSRAPAAGMRVTNDLHYPPYKLAGYLATPVRLREEAAAIGEATASVVARMLDEKPVDRLRAVQGLVGFAKKYGAARLEAACRRAIVFEEASYRSVASILRRKQEFAPLAPEAIASGPVPKTAAFARPVQEIAAGLG